MATTNDGGKLVDLTRVDETGGDDITVVPGSGSPSGPGRGRGVWIWITAGVVTVAALIIGIVAANSSSDSKGTVRTSAQAPVVTQPVIKTTAPTKHATETTVAAPTPTTSVTHTTNASTHAPTPPPPPAPPANNTPPVTAPPQPLGPSALTWNAPTTFSISKDGTTLTVTVANNTNRPAYTPMPLNCLAYGDHVCAQHTQTLQPGEHVTEKYTLDASQFTSTPTAVYVGGYFKVMISA